ncbi:MAG: hypothetical protein DRJ36_03295 [Thermoprotei archaeon]|nr:MAG: hypothetical protein DRJ36_03295 [Thermoprotei archaeon]
MKPVRRELKPIEVIVAEVLEEVERKRLSLRLTMERYFSDNPDLYPVKGVIRAFSLAVLRNFRLLDTIIKCVFDLQADRLSPFMRNLLRAVVYEIVFRDIKSNRIKALTKYFKGQLNITYKDFRILRGLEIREVLKGYGGLERLAVRYSQPLWVVKYLVKILGEDETIKLLKRFNEPATLWIRVNTLKISTEGLLKRLRGRGLSVVRDDVFFDTLKIEKVRSALSRLPEYKERLFYIQDKASILVGHIVSPEANQLILDACAAPGSKTTHLAQLSALRARIIATDISLSRLLFLKKYSKEAGFDNIDIFVADARAYRSPVKFDKILVDPDCSSLGILGHSPEVRLWIKESYIKTYADIQYSILRNVLEMVKRNGLIVYSTCTFTVEENECNVKRLLEEFGNEVELVEHEPFIGRRGLLGFRQMQRLYPHVHDTIGFTISVLKKIK